MSLSLTTAEKYYKKEKRIPSLIRSEIKEHRGVLYGSTAMNKYAKYKRNSRDFDVFAENAPEFAQAIEQHLDKRLGGNYFTVKSSQAHPGSFEIISNVTGVVMMEVTTRGIELPVVNIGGMLYVDKEWIKRSLREILDDKAYEYRHAKAIDDMRRLELSPDKHYKVVKMFGKGTGSGVGLSNSETQKYGSGGLGLV